MLTQGAVTDVNHDMSKTRLSVDGAVVEAPKGKELKGDLERIAATKAAGGELSLLALKEIFDRWVREVDQVVFGRLQTTRGEMRCTKG